MTRDHIEFIHHSELAWEDCDVEGLPPGTDQKVLSEDDETGASTRMLRLTDERRDPVTNSLSWNAGVEILVLDGEFWIGGHRLEQYDHAYLPPEAVVTRFGASREATALFMPDEGLSTTGGDEGVTPQVTYSRDLQWEALEKDTFPSGALLKHLYEGDDTGNMTWLLGVLPGWKQPRIEKHPVVEESYQLRGSIRMDRGLFSRGSYFWRPPDVPHGPFESEEGCLLFFRTRGGPLETEYIENTAEK
jgi:hypothetical protein